MSPAALQAENDQLRAALAEALRIHAGGALAVTCPSCGAKQAKPCWGNGPMPAHEVRREVATAALGDTLRAALGLPPV